MTKIQRKNKDACRRSWCRHYTHCKVYWGRQCNRQGGKKVPRFRPKPEYYSYDIAVE